jgi:hypothetical protein
VTDFKEKLMRKFSLPETSHLAGVPLNTLTTWVQRGFLPCRDDEGGGRRGVRRLLSSRAVTAVAVMQQLTSLGLSPADASNAAMCFAFTGNEERGICELYPSGRTLLVVYPSQASSSGRTSCVILNECNGKTDGDILMVVPHEERSRYRGIRGAVVLQLDHVVQEVFAGMESLPFGSDD